MEAFGFSVEETSGVLVANMLEGMKFSLGPTMVFRRECVRKFGGFGTVAKFPAEDFELARRVGMAGYDVVLSGHAVDHTAKSRSLRELFAFQLRWARYARHYRPKGHLGSGLIFAMPYGLLGLFAAIASGRPLFGALLLLAALVQRTALSVVAGLVVRDRRAITACWLYPVRDLLGFAFWCAGYAGRDVTWSQERYFISPSGELVRRSAAEVKLPASDAV
jgi:ceramide glucosyltransferase